MAAVQDALARAGAFADELRAEGWRLTYQDDSNLGRWSLSREESLTLMLGSGLVYLALLVVVRVLRPLLRPLLYLRDAHNFLLCVFSGLCMGWTFAAMFSENHFESIEAAVCRPIANRDFQIVSFLFVLSKIWEWFDTVLLVLKGSSLRFVHVIHHATTFWLYAVNSTMQSSSKYGVAMNGLIHTVMYAHYWRPFPRQYRRFITQLQLFQFAMAICTHSAIYYFDCDKNVHTHFYEYITPFILVVGFSVLFLNFYLMQYIKPAAAKTKQA